MDITGAKLLQLYSMKEMPKRRGRVEARGGRITALVVQAIEYTSEPMCPECCQGIEDDLPDAGAGLISCPYCGTLVVVLRLMGKFAGGDWYSFPWPE